MSDWHVGMQVVCVDDRGHMLNHGESIPIRGSIYTIRSITHGGAGVQLNEIVNLPRMYCDGFVEISFLRRRFRPVRKTNIDCFLSLLNKTPADVVAATTSPALVSLSDHVAHERTCQFANADRTHSLPAGNSLRPNWTRVLPAKVDGRASDFLHPSSSSGDCLQLSLVDSKEAPRWRTITPSADLFSPSARKDA